MLTDVAFRVGQTLTSAVTLPASDTNSSYRTAENKRLGQRLAALFGLPLAILRNLASERRQARIDQELASLPDSVLGDLGIDRHMLRGRNEIHGYFTETYSILGGGNWRH